MKRTALVLMLGLGCGSPPVLPPVEVPAPAPDELTIRALLGSLQESDVSRRKVAVEWMTDLGPAAAPVIRDVLTCADLDPTVLPLLQKAAMDELLTRGAAIQAELWETLFTTGSKDIALRAVQLLTLMDADPPPPLAVLEILMKWGALPAYEDHRAPVSGKTGASSIVRVGDPQLRFGRIKGEVLTPEFILLFTEEETDVYFEPVQKDP
jgi:hypothetical protein